MPPVTERCLTGATAMSVCGWAPTEEDKGALSDPVSDTPSPSEETLPWKYPSAQLGAAAPPPHPVGAAGGSMERRIIGEGSVVVVCLGKCAC